MQTMAAFPGINSSLMLTMQGMTLLHVSDAGRRQKGMLLKYPKSLERRSNSLTYSLDFISIGI